MKPATKKLAIAAIAVAVLIGFFVVRRWRSDVQNMDNYFRMTEMLRRGATADEMESFLKRLPPDQRPKGY